MIRATLLATLFLFGSVFANPVPEEGEAAVAPAPVATETSNVLKGVTIENRPFSYEEDGKIQGFVVDMMDYISKRNGFQYELYFTPDNRYGNPLLNNNVTGLIGEVFHKKADFAVADLTVTETRAEFVDFTEPFIVNQLSALVKRDEVEGMNSLEDLANSIGKPGAKNFTFLAFKSGTTYDFLSKSEDPVIKRIFATMNENDLVIDMRKGVDKVVEGGHAFIVESSFAEHQVISNCQLTMLKDTHNLQRRMYAIALPKGSKHLEKFNEAIKEMVNNGEITKLKDKYWPNDCEKPNKTVSDSTPS